MIKVKEKAFMLNKKQIIKLIKEESLIEEIVHLDTQITPNGFDITVDSIYEFEEAGEVDFSNSERSIPDGVKVEPDKRDKSDDYGWWNLERGIYKVKANEKFNIPNDLVAFAFPRSSLLRMGVITHTAMFEAGFSGKVEFSLIVNNPEGVSIKENARVTQVVFQPIDEVDQGYDGQYQNLE